jgi:rubrerythrin
MAKDHQGLDRVLAPLHRWVWADPHRRAQKLLVFAETEADGGRDLARASELTKDALLRRLYLRHAQDEQRHAEMFRVRARELLESLPRETSGVQANWLTPGERGLDDLRVEGEKDDSLLAFLHLSERAAAQRFAVYSDVLDIDVGTQDVFRNILRDEAFHMNYTYTQLRRVAPKRHGARLWLARASRLWKGYLRVSSAVAGLLGFVFLLVQYFVLLPVFALLAKRAAKKENEGFTRKTRERSLASQY